MDYKELVQKALDNGNYEHLTIKVKDRHLERIRQMADRIDVTPSEFATFMLSAVINDIELEAYQFEMQNLNKN